MHIKQGANSKKPFHCHLYYACRVTHLVVPQLMLGDIVISVETAARQAEERGHTLLDETCILMVG